MSVWSFDIVDMCKSMPPHPFTHVKGQKEKRRHHCELLHCPLLAMQSFAWSLHIWCRDDFIIIIIHDRFERHCREELHNRNKGYSPHYNNDEVQWWQTATSLGIFNFMLSIVAYWINLTNGPGTQSVARGHRGGTAESRAHTLENELPPFKAKIPHDGEAAKWHRTVTEPC